MPRVFQAVVVDRAGGRPAPLEHGPHHQIRAAHQIAARKPGLCFFTDAADRRERAVAEAQAWLEVTTDGNGLVVQRIAASRDERRSRMPKASSSMRAAMSASSLMSVMMLPNSASR